MVVCVKKVHRSEIIVIIVKVSVSLKQSIGFDFHLQQVSRRENVVFMFLLYWWVVLVAPTTSIAVSICVVFTLQERFALFLIITDVCSKDILTIKQTYQLVDQSFAEHRT